jgi:antitoxin MazE
MHSKIAKWGNSLAIRIPASVARDAAVVEGDIVEVKADDGSILITSSKPPPLRMADILAQMTDENIHESIDFGAPVGKELL